MTKKATVTQFRKATVGIDEAKTFTFKDEIDVEVRQYLPLLKKVELISKVYVTALSDDDGLHLVDNIIVDMAYRVFLAEYYTNLKLPQQKRSDDGKYEVNVVESYDLLCGSGLMSKIYENIPRQERNDIEQMLSDYIHDKRDEYEQRNSIKFMISNFINNLPTVEESQELMNEAKSAIDNFDPDKMEMIKQVMGRFGADISG